LIDILIELTLIVSENIEARGHQNISATNSATFEITKENWLTRKGDCILAIGATKGAFDLSSAFKMVASQKNVVITFYIEVGGMTASTIGRGDSQLSFTHPMDLVGRKSNYTCNRTLMINSEKSALDFPRELIKKLKNYTIPVKIRLTAEI
jgi:hypothetical protein